MSTARGERGKGGKGGKGVAHMIGQQSPRILKNAPVSGTVGSRAECLLCAFCLSFPHGDVLPTACRGLVLRTNHLAPEVARVGRAVLVGRYLHRLGDQGKGGRGGEGGRGRGEMRRWRLVRRGGGRGAGVGGDALLAACPSSPATACVGGSARFLA